MSCVIEGTDGNDFDSSFRSFHRDVYWNSIVARIGNHDQDIRQSESVILNNQFTRPFQLLHVLGLCYFGVSCHAGFQYCMNVGERGSPPEDVFSNKMRMACTECM